MDAAPKFGITREEQLQASNMTLPASLQDERFVLLKSGLNDAIREKPDLRIISSVLVEEFLDEWEKSHTSVTTTKEDWETIETAQRFPSAAQRQ